MELKYKQKNALGSCFFISGMCFATWASRIPTIKDIFNLNEAELGTVLFLMPISSLIGLPISGWLVSKYDSKKPLIASFVLFIFTLIWIGYVRSYFFLIISLCLYAFFIRIITIAINTQSLSLQKSFNKPITGTLHGLWSVGGLFGVAVSTYMIKMDISMFNHFLIVSFFSLSTILLANPFILKGDKSTKGNKLIIGKPDAFILYLGLIIFVAAICEGGMYDWIGIYFKDVIKVKIFTLGYLSFMICMACSRFFIDAIVAKIGFLKTYWLSAITVFVGIILAVIYPNFWSGIIGFSLVAIGISSLFPLTFLLAGKSKKYSPGIAISIISTYGIAGMFIGPPLIGYLAHYFNLRYAFMTFAIAAILIIPISHAFFKINSPQD